MRLFRAIVITVAAALAGTQAFDAYANSWPVWTVPHASYYPPPYPYTAYNPYPAPVYPGTYPRYAYPPWADPASPAPAAREDKSKGKFEAKPDTENENSGKLAFASSLLPVIHEENARLAKLRKRSAEIIRALDNGYRLPADAREWLQAQARHYSVKSDPVDNEGARAELLRKIDIIPVSLALAQAANESAWGKSRFAREANNLFGIWTYDQENGLKPRDRDSSKTHLIRKFDSADDSIRYYMHMLNSHPAYKQLRIIRGAARQERRVPNGVEMARGLEKYSAKGKRYIELIQQLIEQNQWAELDRSYRA